MQLKPLSLLAVAGAALALSACATSDQSSANTANASGRDCFASDSITGYNVVDDHHVNVNVGANRIYTLELDWNAHDLNWTEAIAIRSTTSFICTGNGLGVNVYGGEPRWNYFVTAITRAPDRHAEPDQQQQGS